MAVSSGQTPGVPSVRPPVVTVAPGTTGATETGNSTSPTVAVKFEKADPKGRDKDAVKEVDGMRLADSAKCEVYVCFKGPWGTHLKS